MKAAAQKLAAIFVLSGRWKRRQLPRVRITIVGAGVTLGYFGEVPFRD